MEKLDKILHTLDDLKLLDIIVYDMRTRNPFFDHVILATATNKRQLQAAFRNVKEVLAKEGYDTPRSEGDEEAAWVLIDAQEVIVNVFLGDERAFYHFEKLWPDVPHARYEGA